MKRSLVPTEAIHSYESKQPSVDSMDREARVRDRDPIWASPRVDSGTALIAARELYHAEFAAPMPATSTLKDDKVELSYNVRSTCQGVDTKHRNQHLLLRRDTLLRCVTNTDFIGVGASLDIGTISPQVNRQTREIRR